MRAGRVGVCLATILSRAMPKHATALKGVGNIGVRAHGEVILRENLDHANQTIASAAGQAQLAYYQMLERQGHLSMIRNAADLRRVWSRWSNENNTDAPVGYILSMEGADPIVEPDHAQWWWNKGLRTACLAHYGPSAYAMGTGGDGPLTDDGRRLLKTFTQLGIVLDLVHTADTALAEALEIYGGPVFVSHGNCRALVDHDRQLSDEQIRWVAQRGGVIGVVLDCWMIVPDFHKDPRQKVTFNDLADHIDHICQVTGSARHVAIGSDLDGGFGTEQTPSQIKTIADMQKLEPILAGRGYGDDDIDGIFHGHWLRFFEEALPRGAS
jgi:membrane dipeptidase